MKDKKPDFKKIKVYFSNSVTGVADIKRDFGWNLVNYMKELGCDVIDDFVGARSKNEHVAMFYEKTGYDRRKHKEPWYYVRKNDILMVDEATHMVAVVNGPSFGVGMELQRALDKPSLNLSPTPILCLVHEDLLQGLSFMVRGVSRKENSKFELKTYKNLTDAKRLIKKFLLKYT